MGNQDVDVFKRDELKSKIVFLLNGHPIRARLQYNGAWGMSLSIAKINYYGNKSSL
jgi:hypothetical protein